VTAELVARHARVLLAGWLSWSFVEYLIHGCYALIISRTTA
jgi:hypothetical protein